MKVACIGGAGFLGSSLFNRLKMNAAEAYFFDKNDSLEEWVNYIDLEDAKSLDVLKGFDCIINLAAVHRDDIRPLSLYEDVNVGGAKKICNAARRFGIQKIIFTSSVAIYGFADPNTDEDGEPNFFNEYGRTKYLAEQEYKTWHAEDPKNRTLVIVRPTVIFGEGNRGNVYNLLKQIASRRFVMFGDGKNYKSMAYVENVAAFLEYSLKFSSGMHTYNYIDKPDMNMNELISKIRETLFGKKGVGFRLPTYLGILLGYFADFISWIIKRPLPISSIRIRKFMGTTQFSSSIDQTDFNAPVSLSEGLERTLKYEFLEKNKQGRTFETE